MAALLAQPQKHLTSLQWQTLRHFFSSPVSAPFFLTGGTALAGFYFAHRTSVDLDLFTLQSLDHAALKSHLNTIANQLQGIYTPQTEAPTILTGFLKTDTESLKIDFVQDIPIHIGELQVHQAIRIDSLANIGSNKITAIYGRLAAKDFVDLYWILCRTSFKFPDLLAAAKKKDLGLADFHLAHIFLNPPPESTFPSTTPTTNPTDIISFFRGLGKKLLATAEKPSFG